MYYIDNKSKRPKLKRKLKNKYLKGQRGVRLYYDSKSEARKNFRSGRDNGRTLGFEPKNKLE